MAALSSAAAPATPALAAGDAEQFQEHFLPALGEAAETVSRHADFGVQVLLPVFRALGAAGIAIQFIDARNSASAGTGDLKFYSNRPNPTPTPRPVPEVPAVCGSAAPTPAGAIQSCIPEAKSDCESAPTDWAVCWMLRDQSGNQRLYGVYYVTAGVILVVTETPAGWIVTHMTGCTDNIDFLDDYTRQVCSGELAPPGF